MTPITSVTPITLETLVLQHRIDQFNAAYAAALDEQRFDDWPLFFLADGRYKLQSRENHARGFALALMDLESQGMMKDRIYGVTQTIYHAPYYTRHVVSPARILSIDGDDICCETHYAVLRTRPAGISEVYSVGRYVDVMNNKDGVLRFRSRLCVYDSELVLNSLIYPI